MARKVRPVPFTPAVEEIRTTDVSGIRGLEATISYWTEGAYSAEEWFADVLASWGAAALVMRRGDEVLGFAVYGPPGYLPRAGRYPVGPLGENNALLAHLRGDTRTRRHLLVRVMRDLDRKSTRLNSSHANISYAVFCLKKKKNTSISYLWRRTKDNMIEIYFFEGTFAWNLNKNCYIYPENVDRKRT